MQRWEDVSLIGRGKYPERKRRKRAARQEAERDREREGQKREEGTRIRGKGA